MLTTAIMFRLTESRGASTIENVMKTTRTPLVVGLLLLVSVSASAFDEILEEIDDLHSDERYEQVFRRIDAAESAARTNAQRAQLAWRRARSHLARVDRELAAERITDSEAAELFEEGEQMAQAAIDNDPDLAEGWFWKAANMGRRGQARGVLRSLFMASDVRDLAFEAVALDEDLTEPYFLLGVMYRELPGGIISFGDDQKAVSLARLAVDRHENDRARGDADGVYYNYYIELAHNLWERNWSRRRRSNRHPNIRSDYRSADSNLDRAFNYEGSVRIPDQSDREEALELLEWVIDEIESLPDPKQGELDDLAEARELWDDWN